MFRNPHPRQLENALKWLRVIHAQIAQEISGLEAQLESRAAADGSRAAFNELMREMIAKNLSEAEALQRLAEMGWRNPDHKGSARRLRLLAAARARELRNQEIVRRILVNKEKPGKLAREYQLSRNQIYNIYRAFDPLRRRSPLLD